MVKMQAASLLVCVDVGASVKQRTFNISMYASETFRAEAQLECILTSNILLT